MYRKSALKQGKTVTGEHNIYNDPAHGGFVIVPVAE